MVELGMQGKAEEAQQQQSTVTGKCLLVVDDELSVRQALERVLQLEGYHVTAVATSEEVFNQLDKRAVDLVLLDINLAGESGLAVCQQIRAAQPHLTVIGITAIPDQATAAMIAGMNVLLEKPLDMTKLLDTIRHACG
jgi:DNA-binding NtrC family response regulator